ncbi:hypothetical protein F3K33_14180 [Clostridium diolis]|nr:hypothetical protein X276_27575 [Clostridium beijerinckii NRRL B-598]QES76171.1 hypothetical protein F3K33_14180 [Clostridium diolis]
MMKIYQSLINCYCRQKCFALRKV